jgi:hypothetical protein
MKFHLPVLLAGALVVSVYGCKKKDDTSSTTTTQTTSQFMSGFKSTSQKFKLTAGLDQVLIGKQGTIIHFYPNSFKDATGAIISSGTVNIELIEMYDPGYMIVNNASTSLTDGKPLESTGQIYINATGDAGKEVFANKYGIAFKASGATSKPMELYYGDRNNADSTVKWNVSPENPGTRSLGARVDSNLYNLYVTDPEGMTRGPVPYRFPGFYHIFDSCTDFKWVNSDHPFVTEAKIVYFKLNVSDVDICKSAFIVYPDYNSVLDARLSTYMNKVSLGKIYAVMNSKYKFYILGNKGDRYYYGETSGTVTSDTVNLNVSMGEETLFNIKARLMAQSSKSSEV